MIRPTALLLQCWVAVTAGEKSIQRRCPRILSASRSTPVRASLAAHPEVYELEPYAEPTLATLSVD